MYSRFYPDFRFDSIKEITADFFAENGIKYAILDIDNTLVGYKTKKPDETAKKFLDILTQNGVKFALVSNNHKKRVELFASDIDAPFVSGAAKPFTFGIRRAMAKIGAKSVETVLIGDQVFTDIYAGKRTGIKTVMVSPIEAKETPFFSVKRYFERKVLKDYKG
ncbi:MAG: YqeG family HAD IIIA-type phosphatase [Clostridia bacterium]|nr:YqeG family HAD IIIA-type phosphatase [Clostridia bacterium]